MDRLADITGESLMIWGRQDPYIPTPARAEIQAKLNAAQLNFTWHEFNAQHAFMRDSDERYDAQTSLIGYQLALNLFSRKLSD